MIFHLTQPKLPCSSSSRRLATTAVVSQQVGGSRTGTDNRYAQLLDAITDTAATDALKSHQVRTQTADVGRGHGGTGQRAAATTWIGGDDTVARSVDINYRIVSLREFLDMVMCVGKLYVPTEP